MSSKVPPPARNRPKVWSAPSWPLKATGIRLDGEATIRGVLDGDLHTLSDELGHVLGHQRRAALAAAGLGPEPQLDGHRTRLTLVGQRG